MPSTPEIESTIALKHLHQLNCPRIGDNSSAGLWTLSLPWPCASAKPLSLGGRATYQTALGQWPGATSPAPRRLLMIADGANAAPSTIHITDGAAAPAHEPPAVAAELMARSQQDGYTWEQHRMRLRFGSQSVGLALGIRHAGKIHWWESCRLIVLEQTTHCTVAQMGGTMARVWTDRKFLEENVGFKNPLLHKHNWLNGDLFVRAHANGVVEVFAHFVNSRYVDEGGDLADVVPVLGLTEDKPDGAHSLVGPWDGSQETLTLGTTVFDMSEMSRLATAEKPGRIDVVDGMIAIEPFMGVELYSGVTTFHMNGDPFLFKAENKLFPRGMARTLRFSLSLNPDRSPKIARYIAPYWWYAQNRELRADAPWLPAENELTQRMDDGANWIAEHIVRRGFEDGSAVRVAPSDKRLTRMEPGWEGDVPYAQFLNAYRTADEDDYLCALRNMYFFSDVAVDHALRISRMHSYPPPAISLPMNRVTGAIVGYLETGDPYLLDIAESCTENAYRLHLNSWPRLAVGRDSCFVRGAVMLYRYFNNEHFRKIARHGAMSVAQTQRENGSFGDQGGGTGIHAWGAYITKPWMALLSTMPVMDYLELFPEDEPLRQCILKVGKWLLDTRWTRSGKRGWSYQHDYDGKPKHFDLYSGKWWDLPTADRWHEDSVARVMAYCFAHTLDNAYPEAFFESLDGYGFEAFDHKVSATLQYIPRFNAHLWRATLTDHGIETQPIDFGPKTPRSATLATPEGPMKISR